MELVYFRFVAGHPQNDMKQDSTYLSIDKFNNKNKSWSVILRDNDWETEFEWIRTSSLLGTSEAEIRWYVPKDQESGTYRISHFGAHKAWMTGSITSYSGVTSEFNVF